ncbi:fructosamine kinase family protein [Rasiella rasia]|uniref:Fructosamine kinase family protein n=1 Tax=Rasiella rasia TaxID=2744027 RepID=A0A6G6GNU4_9FLAO|nr:fructosamine kinase family protein [Rasiella rasia]QIE60219.1 fructosamine kinase family protein [Rasiella rasia]
MHSILNEIAERNSLKLIEFQSLAGGDINAVYLLKCSEGNFVVKLNEAAKFPKMFQVEAKGLQLLEATNSFNIPKVLDLGEIKAQSYILLEFVEKGRKTPDFWSVFAENLAKMHKITQHDFGLSHSNYIGSLKQVNGFEETSAAFYIEQRLKPQFALASKNGFNFENLSSFFQNISDEIPNEAPSFIHGDLWNGNYLVSATGNAVLIDPAVAYASREMDIAMMHLFGGFPPTVYSFYHEIFPLKSGWKQRIPIFQLYYLLVHLNLFGRGYLSQAKSIVASFS